MITDSTPEKTTSPYLKLVAIIFSGAITFGLLTWSLVNYQPTPTFYGPRAIYGIVILSVVLAVAGRFLLLRLLQTEMGEADALHAHLYAAWRMLFLFDVTAPISLAAGVLIGPPAAVLTALITQGVVQVYTLTRGFVSPTEALYRIASTGLLVLISAMIFTSIAGPSQNHFVGGFQPVTESYEFLGSILAAAVMMVLLVGVSLPLIMQANRVGFRAAWQVYIHSPVPRFQLLVLSVGPLLPAVEIFDDLAAELAWLFFLVPLLAIYYLALVSTRLSMRTDELQHTLQDLSSARRRQGELRDYASLITRVQEEERRRLARELHDDTAQALIALSRGLDGLSRAVKKENLPQKDAAWLDSLQDLADRTLEGVRRACRDLRPSVLDDLGLRAALEWLCSSSSARGVACTFICMGTPFPASPEAEIAVFRIVQEALSNIWRHASASRVDVELAYCPDLLQLKVRDDGLGFDSEAYLNADHNAHSGLGLVGMRERAMLIDAVLHIHSASGEGCIISLSLPRQAKDSVISTT